MGCNRSARFLNRVVTYTPEGIEFEADQRLVETLVSGLNLESGRSGPTPGSKPKPIPKAEHQKIMERRLGEQGGRDCTISNLKSEIG